MESLPALFSIGTGLVAAGTVYGLLVGRLKAVEDELVRDRTAQAAAAAAAAAAAGRITAELQALTVGTAVMKAEFEGLRRMVERRALDDDSQRNERTR